MHLCVRACRLGCGSDEREVRGQLTWSAALLQEVHYGFFPGRHRADGSLETLWVMLIPHRQKSAASTGLMEHAVELDADTGTDIDVCVRARQSAAATAACARLQARPLFHSPPAPAPRQGPSLGGWMCRQMMPMTR